MAAGDPTGSNLTSVTFTTEGLTFSEFVWTVFTFDAPLALTSRYRYAIVVGSDDAILSDDLTWMQDTDAGYADGVKCISSDSGASWTQSPTRDCTFRVNSSGGQQESFETQNAKQAIYSPFYAAQTFTATSSYSLVSVALLLNIESIAPTRTVTVSIRAVETSLDPPVSSTQNNMATTRRLVAAANGTIWYEDI